MLITWIHYFKNSRIILQSVGGGWVLFLFSVHMVVEKLITLVFNFWIQYFSRTVMQRVGDAWVLLLIVCVGVEKLFEVKVIGVFEWAG